MKKKQLLPTVVNDLKIDSTYILYIPLDSNLPFVPTGAGEFHAYSRYFVERDNLDMFLIIYTTGGMGELLINGKTYSLFPGSVVFINGFEYHRYRTKPDHKEWLFKWVRFSSPYMATAYKAIYRKEYVQIITADKRIEDQMDQYLKYIRSDLPERDFIMSSLIHNILGLMTEFNINSKKEVKKNHVINEAKTYIEEHFDENINIEVLAKKSNYSKYAFIRVFNQQVGTTPYAFLQKTRITKALYYLNTTDLPINQIAFLVGFSEQNNFAKQFKKYVNMTPTEYRNCAEIKISSTNALNGLTEHYFR